VQFRSQRTLRRTLLPLSITIFRIATSEGHVQRMANDGLDLSVDNSSAFSERPGSLSTSPTSPN
jgi:hypothetical protein